MFQVESAPDFPPLASDTGVMAKINWGPGFDRELHTGAQCAQYSDITSAGITWRIEPFRGDDAYSRHPLTLPNPTLNVDKGNRYLKHNVISMVNHQMSVDV